MNYRPCHYYYYCYYHQLLQQKKMSDVTPTVNPLDKALQRTYNQLHQPRSQLLRSTG